MAAVLVGITVTAAVPAVASATPTSISATPTARPGAVLRVETLPAELVLTRASSARHFEYSTTGPNGRAATSLGTLYVPKGTPPRGGWPVVSYGHGTAGLSDQVVSYTGWVGKDNTGDQYLSRWLDAGFAVAASEYVGIGTPGVHPYLNTRSEGAAMIDVVRAARSVDPSLSRIWVANGYSQGGHASVAAASMARTYAPELRMAGSAAGGVPAGIADELALVTPAAPVNPSPDLSVYLAYVLAGFRAAQPDYPLDTYLSPRGAEVLALAEKLDYFDLGKAIGSAAPGELVSRPLSEGTLLAAIRRNSGLPVARYGVPVLIYQQAFDAVSPAPFSARLADDLRGAGTSVTYRLDRSPAGHAAWDEALDQVLRFARTSVDAAR
ncbi:lipase family protein [Gordonia soli]|uniref:lipase family protein n=1 Tax=Gordonia soli TaxID=320799 RepID=UPI0012F97C94|nr:lipase family protein [Gordonia soli]